MGWKKKPYNYKWDHTKIDHDELAMYCMVLFNWAKRHRNEDPSYTQVIHYSLMVMNGAKVGSILVDLDYGSLHDAVESLNEDPSYARMVDMLEAIYRIADIGTLAQDHIERQRKEDAWMIEKGFKNEAGQVGGSSLR